MIPRATALEQDVRRLDVAVHEALCVRGVEAIGHLRDHRDRLLRRQPAPLGEQLREIRPFDEAHRHVELAGLLAGIEHRNHVGMVDRGRQLRLALEAAPEILIGREVRRDELDRALALERNVRGPVDHAHAAASDQLVEAIAGDHVADCRPGHRAARPSPSLTPRRL